MMGRLAIFLYRFQIRLRNRIFSSAVRGAFFRFGKGSTIQLPASLWGETRVAIGTKVHIGPDSWIQYLGGEEGDSPVIEIGDGCSLSGGVVITAVSKVTLGQNVLIGRNVHISDHSHEFSATDVPIMKQGLGNIRPVSIGDGAWIGQGVVICPGSIIGKNAVIGANSVVKGTIPDHSVAVGAPARIVRGRQG
jgi:acetyltransferase-like isoleucine patch superfamily enzyme